MGPRWQISQLQLDLDPQYMLTVTHQYNRVAMTVPRLTIKDQKVGGSPIPGTISPSPKIVGLILPLISL